jgi:chaperonin cofactor prefoldin
MKKTETEQILEYLKHIDESINGPRPKARPSTKEPPLSKRVDRLDEKVEGLDKKVEGLDKKVEGLDKKLDKLDTRVSEGQLGLATLAADTKAQFHMVDAQFQKVDKRFDKVDRSIESTRVQLVGLVELVHNELTGRIVDLEGPGTEGSGGGGRGSGGSGVPLAS